MTTAAALVASRKENQTCGRLRIVSSVAIVQSRAAVASWQHPDLFPDAEPLFQFTTVRYWVTLTGTWDGVHLIAKHFFRGGR